MHLSSDFLWSKAEPDPRPKRESGDGSSVGAASAGSDSSRRAGARDGASALKRMCILAPPAMQPVGARVVGSEVGAGDGSNVGSSVGPCVGTSVGVGVGT